jgi:hypothetical protein
MLYIIRGGSFVAACHTKMTLLGPHVCNFYPLACRAIFSLIFAINEEIDCGDFHLWSRARCVSWRHYCCSASLIPSRVKLKDKQSGRKVAMRSASLLAGKKKLVRGPCALLRLSASIGKYACRAS